MKNRTIKIMEANSTRSMMVEPDAANYLAARDIIERVRVTDIPPGPDVYVTKYGQTLEEVRHKLRDRRQRHECNGRAVHAELQLVIQTECSHHGRNRQCVTLAEGPELAQMLNEMTLQDRVPVDIDLSAYIDHSKN